MRIKLSRIPIDMLMLGTLVLASIGVSACKEPIDEPSLSKNANLSALTVSSGTLDPAFSKDVTEYSVSVGNAVDSITVTGTAAHKRAKLGDGNGVARSLNVGANVIPVIVTAENGKKTKSYVVTVTRAQPAAPKDTGDPGTPADPTKPPVTADANATLAKMTVSAGTLRPAFSPSITEYSVDVPVDTASITVTGVAAGTGASVGGANGVATELKGGANAISIVVTAADKTTKKTYAVNVYRAKASNDPSNADLSDLWILYADIYPKFSPSVTEYTAIVSMSTPTAQIGGKAANGKATLGGDYKIEKVLVPGDNVFKLAVTAPDTTTAKTYTVTVTRSDDVTPPKLIDFTLTKTEINSADGDIVVGGTIIAEDESGIRNVEATLYLPKDYTELTLIRDDLKSTFTRGVYNWSRTIKMGSRGGQYKIRYVTINDNAGNELSANLNGYTTEFVDNAPMGDVTPPTLLDFTLSPTIIDSTDEDVEDRTVSGTIIAKDEGGIRYASMAMYLPHGYTNVNVVRDEAYNTPGQARFTWSYTVAQGSRGGHYRVDYVKVYDNEDNELDADLSVYSTEFVDEAPPGDVTPPTFVKITVDTPKIDSSKGNVIVKGTVVATDAESGVRWVNLDLIDPSGKTHNTSIAWQAGCDPKTNAVFDWSMTVKQGVIAGDWKIYNFEIFDEKFNYLKMYSWDYDVMKNVLFVDSTVAQSD